MFYDIVNDLCKARKTTITKMSEEIGLSNAAATSWKKGSIPKASTLEKISAYFGVSVDYLLGKEDIKKAPTPEGEREELKERVFRALENADPAIREAALRLLGVQE